MTDLKRARTQAVWLMENCPNPDCPIGCPDSHADLGFPEINCGTFRPPNPATIEQWEPWPIGGAHPDTWRAFSPQVPRLYVVGTVAIIAPDPESAWRTWKEVVAGAGVEPATSGL